jgi:hypothetical protein
VVEEPADHRRSRDPGHVRVGHRQHRPVHAHRTVDVTVPRRIQDHSSSTTTKTTGGGGGTTTTRPAPKAGTPDYWGLATDLAKKTNPNPTHAEIEAQYRKITPKAQQKKEEAFNKKKAAAK